MKDFVSIHRRYICPKCGNTCTTALVPHIQMRQIDEVFCCTNSECELLDQPLPIKNWRQWITTPSPDSDDGVTSNTPSTGIVKWCSQILKLAANPLSILKS